MTRREMIDRMFERYGTPVTVYSAGNPPAGARALIQPLSGKLYPAAASITRTIFISAPPPNGWTAWRMPKSGTGSGATG